jgi:signal transduction histidine kinase/CheY-like chemotaxis protein
VARAKPLGLVEAGVSLDEAEKTRSESLFRTTLAALLAIAITGILAWRLSTRLARQINHIGSTVDRLADGDFAVRVDVHPDIEDEISALGADVNVMAEALQRHQAELEQRIAQATADLAAKKESAERANVAKTRFFAAASHDLRQPMHALSLFVAALKARPLPADAQALADQIDASTGAMELMFNALLDISKLDAGVIEAQIQHFPIQPIFDRLAAQFGPVADEKGLRFSIRPSPLYLNSDPLLIERILINLVSNAVRYTEHGGIVVGCRPRGEFVRLAVSDTGSGVPPEQQENIFQEFVQLDNPARDRNKGLGLGLAIVARLARLLGHEVRLDSRPDRGSSFCVAVPRGIAALVRPAAPPLPPPGVLPDDALVVLIDDESAILDGMRALFANWRIGLVASFDHASAVAELDALGRAPDVIVSDYRLPGDDGVAVIARLRARYGKAIPAVVVSGDTAPETIQAISAAGLTVLHKPLRPAKLRALMTHLIQQARTGEGGRQA